ncbi:paraquat-inducible protein A [Pelagicoccus mobilis]|uniref:Paraquat-inducible protein A n=1 Tax=Pelagicoccus mobilis TaxID=415221 RepID=A0A934RST1_9BACT|nr:paraquat-inducible protein A [Pelagicoccus mobilis]MBK1876925.1 paraquat-inducible protein A [Pelagicoccus mobilis]
MAKPPQQTLLPLSLAATICWLFALHFPLAEVEKFGLSNSARLLDIGSTFRSNQQELLGLVAELFLLVFPSLIILLLPIASAPPRTKFRGLAIRILRFARTWAMPEVFALSILVAFIKIGSLANSRVAPGFYFLLACVILLTYVMQKLQLKDAPHWKNRKTAISYIVAASALLIPALTLPITIIASPGGTTQSTLLGGIAELAIHGSWGIAAVVFIASILIPIGKLGSLCWLLTLSPQKSSSPFARKTYRFIDFVGRWSMLDIFLIGFLATLIDFGPLSSIKPGPAAPAFAAAVILTVIAVERFELPSPQSR